jgi:hypothetical protein
VVVALGAANGQPQQRRADDLERVGDDLVGRLLLVGGSLRAIDGRPQKAGRREQFDLLGSQIVPRRRGQFVAGKLLDNEPVQRLVGVE